MLLDPTSKTPVIIEYNKENKVGEEASFLWVFDAHIDNKKADLKRFKRHMDQAVERGAKIGFGGDFFCAMQGKWDKRASQDGLRQEHRRDDYLNALVEWAVELLMPYKDNIVYWGEGNHERGVTKRHGFDLIANTITQLNPSIVKGGYSGFLIHKVNKRTTSVVNFWHHGVGSGAPVTKGMIDWNRFRDQTYADIYCAGHIHQKNLDENLIQQVSAKNKHIELKRQLFVRYGTYKQGDGWLEEKTGSGYRPQGGWWLNFKTVTGSDNKTIATIYTAEMTD